MSSTRALITGIGGFAGRHLFRHLREQGDDVWGLGRPSRRSHLPDDVRVLPADLRDADEVLRVVRATQPEVVYHLAAQASTGESLVDPWETLRNNLEAQRNLFEAILAAGLSPRVLVVGSGDEYGQVQPEEIPTDERIPLRPITPYAVSKVGQDMMGYQYFAQYGLPVIRVRPFSHTGPGHDDRFAIPSFAKQLAEIETGQREPILRVGNLDVERDLTDVRDMVRAYRHAVLEGGPGEVYNLGRGASRRLSEIVEELVSLCRVPVRVVVDPARLRPSDVPRQQADTTRFISLTGWQPRIAWRTTLSDTLEYWRLQIGSTKTLSRV